MTVETVEIESVDALLAHLRGGGTLRGVVVQGLDLTPPEAERALLAAPAAGAYLLGCRLRPALEQHLRTTGAVLFPAFDGLPFNPYRAALYTPDELMAGYEPGRPASLAETLDGRIYAHFAAHRQPEAPVPVLVSLAYRLHDHAIDDALHELLYPSDGPPRRVVGVMGGHGLRRDAEAFAQVAEAAWQLARRGYFIASGGGPGAMEAANLGAYLSAHGPEALQAALGTLAARPHYTEAGYIEAAYTVREAYPGGQPSLAIPTWFYGHEPTNLFASHAAKYFANSLREDGLLAIARHGVVYAPGSAGTVQEVFMDAAQNHYVTFGAISPMVFLGRNYWTCTLPVYPLLKALAGSRPYARLMSLCDDVEAVVAFITTHEPVFDAG